MILYASIQREIGLVEPIIIDGGLLREKMNELQNSIFHQIFVLLYD
jgi:hypothetical protein